MKRFGWFPVLAIGLILGGTGLAQKIGDNSVYFVTYYSNANTTGAPDQTVRVINDGDTEANLWASFYVFDDSEEMQECCSCQVSPNGLTSESVNSNLTANSLTAHVNTRGAIKVISSSVAAGGPANFTNTPVAGLRVWSTHIQRRTPGAGGYHISETLAADSNLVSSEKAMAETLCFYINLLADGNQGVCSCTPEGQDF
jgi:hypothetical protein